MADLAALPLDDPGFYDWFIDVPVRFSDTDLIGHVNNIGHTAIVETARISHIMDVLRPTADSREGALNPVMFVRLELDFRADLFWPSTPRCGARCVRVGTSSFVIAIGVFDGDRCVTTSLNVMVYMADGGSTPLPDDVRAILEASVPT